MLLEAGPLQAEVAPLSASIARFRARLPDGRTVAPLFENPWRDDPGDMEPFLRNLGGEWPCVPFGLAPPEGELPPEWRIPPAPDWNKLVHGFCSHAQWRLERLAPGALVARVDYPAGMPVAALERRVALDPAALSLRLSLAIEAREDARVAVGLHAVFALADAPPGSARLAIRESDSAWSFPVDLEPGRSAFAPDQRGVPLPRMAASGGGELDGTSVPLAGRTEDLVQLVDPGGAVRLERPDAGYAVAIEWDAAALPSCALWYSMGGRDYAPWNGRIRALGVEPIAVAFNLGQPHALAETPLTRAGIPTAVALRKGERWSTDYAIAVTPLPRRA